MGANEFERSAAELITRAAQLTTRTLPTHATMKRPFKK